MYVYNLDFQLFFLFQHLDYYKTTDGEEKLGNVILDINMEPFPINKVL